MNNVVNLRDYQADMVAGVRDALRRKVRRVLLQAPTGSGKTVIASFIAREVASRGRRVAFNVHRAELMRGTSNTFRKYGIDHGFVADGHPITGANVQICSIDTLKNRLAVVAEPDVVLWDECHHLGAAGWQSIMEAWPNATHIGLSATPWRLDGSGLDDCFEELIPGPSPAWLMEQGHLSQYEIYAPSAPDMRGARKSRGKAGPEFTAKDASARMDIPKRTGDIIKHWRKLADGMRTIGFAVNVADSLMIVDRFNAAGIPAAHLDGKTPKAERKRIIDAFVDGSIKILFNVALFDEGFDLAAIAGRDVTVDCLIDAAPTMSLSRVLQRWGRVLRAKPYAAIILDHAGNSGARHGFPDDERIWTLQGKDKTGAANDNGPPPPITCTGCFRQIKRPVPECCPSCGKQLLAEFKEIEAAEGELKKVTQEEKAALRATRQREERDAKSLAELVALAHRRKYPNPQGWAFKRWQITLSQQRGKKVA